MSTATTPSVAPGAYGSAQNVTFTFRADVTQVAITLNAAPPSISKYIAYDTLTPANPFIAVTEDGRGRVVYDGGFPKFYNNSNPVSPADFAALSAAGKYLYNALNWVANPAKVAAGNKKVLFLGDTIGTYSYPVKGTGATGFRTTVTDICTVAGFTPSFLDLDDYGGSGAKLDPNLALLEQYACVVIFSSMSSSVPGITAQAVNDLVTYRENGNGIVVITDHGYDLASIADVNTAGVAFFKTANALISKFGAYFTGNYDRSPVQVGFLRSTYGDHPLYNGLTNTDYVPAGGSESKVVVAETTLYAPGSVPAQNVSANGLNTINVLAMLSDGSVVSDRYVYNIQGTEFVFATSLNPATSQNETNSGKAYSDVAGRVNLSMNLDGSSLGTVWGEILLNGKRVGEQYYSDGSAYTYWYAGSAAATPVKNGDSIQQAIGVPFSYTKAITVQRPELGANGGKVSMAGRVKDARTTLGLAFVTNAWNKLYNGVKPLLPVSLQTQKTSEASNAAFIQALADNRLQIVEGLTAKIYQTTAATTTAVAAAPANPGTVIIDAQLNKVYAYKSGSIQEIVGLKAQDFFGAPRVVTSTVDSAVYRLEKNNTITKIS